MPGQLNEAETANMLGVDSFDAFDAKIQLALDDKFTYHAGLNEQGSLLITSVTKNRKTITIVNGTKLQKVITKSGRYQGAPPPVTSWCLYVNTLLTHIEKTAVK